MLVSNAQPPVGDLLHRLTTIPEKEQTEVYKQIVQLYIRKNPDSARFYVNKELELAHKLHDRNAEAYAILQQGDISLTIANYDDAIAKFKESNAMYVDLKSDQGLGATENAWGMALAQKGDFENAVQHLHAALQYAEKLKDTSAIVQCFIKLGAVHEQINNLDKAIEYYTQGMELTKANPEAIQLNVGFVSNLGVVYAKKGDNAKALSYFTYALNNSTDPNLADLHVMALLNMGNIYEQMGKKDVALGYLQQGLALTEEYGWPDQQAGFLLGIASLLKTNKPDSSRIYLEKALAITVNLGQNPLRIDVYEGLVSLYKHMGKYQLALQYLEQKHALEDSLFNIDKSKKIAGLESEYELAKSKIKIQDLELAAQRDRFTRNIILAAGLAVFFIALLLVFFMEKTKKLNQQLKRKQNELQVLNTMKDKVFSVIGHDLRAPLTNIIGMMTIFEEEDLPTEQRTYVIKTLQEQSSTTLDTLDKLLLWGKSQLAGPVLNTTAFEANEIIEKNIQWVKNDTAKKNITVVNHVPSHVKLQADRSHTDFIIRNLLSNAVKFTYPDGKIMIDVAASQTNGMVTLVIMDTGIGMSQEQLQELFSFNNQSTTGTAQERGTSMGLALCKGFIEENGGSITVESNPGKGSRFYVSFKKG